MRDPATPGHSDMNESLTVAALALYLLWFHKESRTLGVRLAGLLGVCVFGGPTVVQNVETLASALAAGETCPICGGALEEQSGKHFKHVWCPTPGHLDAWRDTGK